MSWMIPHKLEGVSWIFLPRVGMEKCPGYYCTSWKGCLEYSCLGWKWKSVLDITAQVGRGVLDILAYGGEGEGRLNLQNLSLYLYNFYPDISVAA